MKVNCDIKSVSKSKIYAVKNTEVKLITEHGHVLIVEDKAGNRFSVIDTEVDRDEPKQNSLF